MSKGILEEKINRFWSLLDEKLSDEDKKDNGFRKTVYAVVSTLFERQTARTDNVLLLDLFSKAGFLVTQEFDGKSWVVAA